MYDFTLIKSLMFLNWNLFLIYITIITNFVKTPEFLFHNPYNNPNRSTESQKPKTPKAQESRIDPSALSRQSSPAAAGVAAIIPRRSARRAVHHSPPRPATLPPSPAATFPRRRIDAPIRPRLIRGAIS